MSKLVPKNGNSANKTVFDHNNSGDSSMEVSPVKVAVSSTHQVVNVFQKGIQGKKQIPMWDQMVIFDTQNYQ